MKPLLCSFRSSAPPDRGWALASDFASASGRIEAITKVEILTPCPVGVGTRFREWRGRHSVDMEIQVRPQTLGAKLLSPLMALMSKLMVKTCAKDPADIAAAAERAAPTSS